MIFLTRIARIAGLTAVATTIDPANGVANAPCVHHRRIGIPKILPAAFINPPNIFRRRRRQQEAPPPSRPATNSRVGSLASAFEGILNGDNNDIAMPQLMLAIRKFEETMRAVGQTQSAKDLHNNLLKVQAAYQAAPVEARSTLASLLAHEKAKGVHSSSSSSSEQLLQDPSGAMGLLWIRRSLAFNEHMYSRVLSQEDGSSSTPTEAALDAYRSQLADYHGVILRKLYTFGMKAATPPRGELLATLNGHSADEQDLQMKEQATLDDLERLVTTWRPLLQQWQVTFDELELDDRRRV